MSAFVEWYEQALPAGRTGDTRVMNIGEECWRAAVEACAKKVEAAGCSCDPEMLDGSARGRDGEVEAHVAGCSIALAAALREVLA